jgi:hypothetical protein
LCNYKCESKKRKTSNPEVFLFLDATPYGCSNRGVGIKRNPAFGAGLRSFVFPVSFWFFSAYGITNGSTE